MAQPCIADFTELVLIVGGQKTANAHETAFWEMTLRAASGRRCADLKLPRMGLIARNQGQTTLGGITYRYSAVIFLLL